MSSNQRAWIRAALLWVITALFFACSSDRAPSEDGRVGAISMALSAVANGRAYRLTHSTFTISGPTPATLDSDDQPDAGQLTSGDLKAGSYSVQLESPEADPWSLERYDSLTWVPVHADLVSPNPVTGVVVNTGATTTVKFSFATDGTIVTLGDTGRLSIGIEVVEIDASSAVDTGSTVDVSSSSDTGSSTDTGTTADTGSSVEAGNPFEAGTCGANGQSCCSGSLCMAGFACSTQKCACIADIAGTKYANPGTTVRRPDGRLYYYAVSSSAPSPVIDAGGIPVSGFVKVATSELHSCGIKDDGSLWCWGNTSSSTNSSGQLGGGNTNPSHATVAVRTSIGGPPLTGAIDVDAASLTSCAIVAPTTNAADNQTYCWGAGATGILGNGLNVGLQTYAGLVLTNLGGPAFLGFDQVSIGRSNSANAYTACARRFDGTVWCWGSNANRQLGDNSTVSQSNVPVQVVGLTDVSEISVMDTAACARVADRVYCWGNNANGRLGDGTTTQRPTPVPVLNAQGTPLTDVVKLRTGGTWSCVQRAANVNLGDLQCWGTNIGLTPQIYIAPGFEVKQLWIWGMSTSGVSFALVDAILYINNALMPGSRLFPCQ